MNTPPARSRLLSSYLITQITTTLPPPRASQHRRGCASSSAKSTAPLNERRKDRNRPLRPRDLRIYFRLSASVWRFHVFATGYLGINPPQRRLDGSKILHVSLLLYSNMDAKSEMALPTRNRERPATMAHDRARASLQCCCKIRA
jgi:hypothetical protein